MLLSWLLATRLVVGPASRCELSAVRSITVVCAGAQVSRGDREPMNVSLVAALCWCTACLVPRCFEDRFPLLPDPGQRAGLNDPPRDARTIHIPSSRPLASVDLLRHNLRAGALDLSTVNSFDLAGGRHEAIFTFYPQTCSLDDPLPARCRSLPECTHPARNGGLQ